MGKKKSKIITSCYDIKATENGETLYFFLEHLLKARIDLHMETGENVYDEEINMYLANLLYLQNLILLENPISHLLI